LSAIADLQPDDLTIHSLAVKRGSRLKERMEEYGVGSLSNTDRMMEIAARGAAAMGLEPYYLYRQKNMSGNFENTGWARPGKEGIYNILMMEEVQSIPAIGAGTISKRVYADGRIKRCDNVKELKQYLSRIDEMLERKRELEEML
nr:coproporphyrinogen dehydrogenase HemZ [Lachnospiraceae bacterium]